MIINEVMPAQSEGVPPSGSGHTPQGGAASSTASPAKPSVPNALRFVQIDEELLSWAKRLYELGTECDARGRSDGRHYNVGLPATDCVVLSRLLLDAMSDPASAIEARSDATGTGAAEGESATAESGDAQ
jgi:hypothetical protein